MSRSTSANSASGREAGHDVELAADGDVGRAHHHLAGAFRVAAIQADIRVVAVDLLHRAVDAGVAGFSHRLDRRVRNRSRCLRLRSPGEAVACSTSCSTMKCCVPGSCAITASGVLVSSQPSGNFTPIRSSGCRNSLPRTMPSFGLSPKTRPWMRSRYGS